MPIRGEMAFTHELAVDVLRSIPQYRAHFKQVFGSDQINIGMVTDAIAAFEETLITPDSRFDKWLNGDKKAMTAMEVEGYELFKDRGCTACHYGPPWVAPRSRRWVSMNPTRRTAGRKAG